MSRTLAIAVATVASLLAGAMAVAGAADTVRVGTRATLDYAPAKDEYHFAHFKGVVRAKKNCDAKRKVVIRPYGKTTTNRRGRYSLQAGSEALPGTYVARVKRRIIEKANGTTIICKRARARVRVRG